MAVSITITKCNHSITEIDGEQVCKNCGVVIGYSETGSVDDWKSHSIGLFGFSNVYVLVSTTAKSLHLPPYAIHTIVQVSSKLCKMQIPKKQAILFATVYSCRIHNIPRLLEDIFYEIEKASGRRIRRSEKSLLKLLNRIAKKISDSEIFISPPNKDYYLQAYLAKIQEVVIQETDEKYFEIMRSRSLRQIDSLREDPSVAAKLAILQSTSRIMQSKVRKALL